MRATAAKTELKAVATAGFLLHYNKAFADLWMEVREDHRRQGLGSYALQEVKKHCYLAGRVPAARCNMKNPGSRATLVRAGMRVCGFVLLGQLALAGHTPD
jgi:GNAT superfamily N-acetyltransferase